jgi:DNA-binding transcriptional LysR family regulator
MFDWNDLKYFLSVADAGSTLAAAKSLGVNQSTVQRRLQELEKRLGCSLVKRHPTGYRLTEIGEQLLARANRIQEAILEFERTVAAVAQEVKGTVRVTCPEALGPRLIGAGLIDRFNERYPDVRIEFVLSDKILDLGSDADIAIRAKRPTETALYGRKIANSPWALYASHSYLARCGTVKRPADLGRHSIVMFNGALSEHDAARRLRSAAPNAHVAARAGSVAALLLSVKSGAGIAAMPTIVGDNEKELRRVLDLGPEMATPFYVLMHKDMRRTPRVRAFFDYVIERLEEIRPLLAARRAGGHPPSSTSGPT